MSYESTHCRMKTTCESMKALVKVRMKDDEKSIDYQHFKASRDVMCSHVGKDSAFPKVLEEDEADNEQKQIANSLLSTKNEQAEATLEMERISKALTDQFLACVHLENSDRSRCGSIMTGLDTQHSLGNDQHPKNLIDAQNVIENHTHHDENYREKREKRNKERKQQETKEKSDEEKPIQLPFAQLKNVCFACGGKHKLPDCPKKDALPRAEWHNNFSKELNQIQAMAAEINKAVTENDVERTAPSSVTERLHIQQCSIPGRSKD